VTPSLDRIDHIHVFVADRAASERWYERVIGLKRVAEFERWAAEGGPLTLANDSGTVHLALFERGLQPCRSTVAFGVGASAFLAWQQHLLATLGAAVKVEDHALSMSLYFSDPDGNPYEITSYEYAAVAEGIEARTE
jgi:catechol-2,3-dioxygenase